MHCTELKLTSQIKVLLLLISHKLNMDHGYKRDDVLKKMTDCHFIINNDMNSFCFY